MIPGDYVLRSEPVTCNEGREAISLEVTNRGDRPVQVGSHFHFAETNRALEFDREAALGRRLDIPAGTAVRLEPGDSTTVRLIPYGGDRVVYGFRDLVDGNLEATPATAFDTARGEQQPPRHRSAAGDAPRPLRERSGFSNVTSEPPSAGVAPSTGDATSSDESPADHDDPEAI